MPRTGSPELCEVAIVPEAPLGKERLGTVQMPADPGQPIIVDPEARRVACGLGARWAVRQQAYVDASGQLMWSMELYAPR